MTHLHGELMKVCSSRDPYDPRYIRTLIVFFGEAVPMIELAPEAVARADIFIIIGTSLNVYPAAGLVGYAKPSTPVYLIDPKPVAVSGSHRIMQIRKGTSKGMRELTAELHT